MDINRVIIIGSRVIISMMRSDPHVTAYEMPQPAPPRPYRHCVAY